MSKYANPRHLEGSNASCTQRMFCWLMCILFLWANLDIRNHQYILRIVSNFPSVRAASGVPVLCTCYRYSCSKHSWDCCMAWSKDRKILKPISSLLWLWLEESCGTKTCLDRKMKEIIQSDEKVITFWLVPGSRLATDHLNVYSNIMTWVRGTQRQESIGR